ncbi:MAG TPA: RES family NAD+ phosphorylase [Roseiarcus sp.]|nr:RES family NAD+ phosphorylase [Roseiarcus sp.]
MTLPPTSLVRRYDTHRLIPAKYSQGGDSVLVRVAASDADLPQIFDLDNATNDRLLAENGYLPGIGVHELVFGVPYYRIVNAAFCHAHPLGSRFNGPDRGAWYAAFELATSQAEIAYHKQRELREVKWREEEALYDDYLADFSAELHDLRLSSEFRACLDPASYVASQDLAQRLLETGALGVVYPSVRKAGGTCLACFRPALVANVRKSGSYLFRWDGERAVVAPHE